MDECLEPRADYYAEIVLHNNAYSNDCEIISRSHLKNLIAEAYKQGWRDSYDNECNHRMPSIPYECMTEETAKELEEILAKTREESVKYAAVQKDLQEIIRQINEQEPPKDLPNLISKEEFRNILNHKE